MGGADIGGRADGEDATTADGDRAVEHDAPLGVERQQVAPGDEEVGGARLAQPRTCSTENSMLLPSGSVTMQM